MTKVAIIEDRREIADSIGRAIDRADDLELAAVYYSAEAALETAASVRPDLFLTDIGLPKMDGVECMVRLKEMLPAAHFLMFTVFDTDDKLFNALRFGADGYILKSEGIIGAMRAIRELIAGGAPMSREMAKRVISSIRTPPAGAANHRFSGLTPRQNEILKLVAEGLYNKEIAGRLGLTEGTVKQHIHAVYKVLEVNNRVEAVNRYLKNDHPG